MELETLQRHWNTLGEQDPLWAILSDPAKRGGGWNHAEFFRTGDEWIAQVIERADSIRSGIRRDRALDFGCGIGRLTQALCGYFTHCDGVDIAPSMIAQANEFNKYRSRCQYHLNQTPDLALFPDEAFDFVYSILVLHHMQPRYSRRYLAEFVRTLAPGGLILFQLAADVVPDGRAPEAIGARLGEPLPERGARAEIELQPSSSLGAVEPLVCRSGEQMLLRVSVKNRSVLPWPALGTLEGMHQIKLAGRWLDMTGAGARDDTRTLLPADVAPGEMIELPFLATPPTEPGQYVLELDMVHEGGPRFSEMQSAAVRVPLYVQPTGTNGSAVEPKIQMYGIPRPQVVAWLRENGGSVSSVEEDRMAGEHWTSFTYAVTR